MNKLGNSISSISTSINSKMKILCDKLLKEGVIKSEKVYQAMLQVDRGEFTDSFSAYDDR
jgi:hypothetical protein